MKNLKTSNYCIAYLDVMGSKNYIYSENTNIFLNDLNAIIEDAIFVTNNTKKYANVEIFYKIFSDNILFAVEIIPFENERKNKIEKLINLVCNCAYESIKRGYLIRGAITEGDFFKNLNFVYGKALVDVVTMEEDKARYPRIIANYTLQKLFPAYFIQGNDGYAELNYFILPFYKEAINIHNTLLHILATNKHNEKATKNNIWIIDRFNRHFQDVNSWNYNKNSLITKKEIENILNN